MERFETDTLVIGAGSVGIAVAYYLKKLDPEHKVLLVDCGQPMAFTSAQSGENYRNWWPHPMMRSFTDKSIDLMEEIAAESDNIIQMTRRGYLLASRGSDIDSHVDGLRQGYSGSNENSIRVHGLGETSGYQPALTDCWKTAPSGVDVLTEKSYIERLFPYFDNDIRSIIHIRRAGTISGQQMGQYMLQAYKACGGKRATGMVSHIEKRDGFQAHLDNEGIIRATQIVNAAGPFVGQIAEMLDVHLPIQNWLQQKIAFEDIERAVPRQMPFAIDLDSQYLDWDAEDRELLAADPNFSWLAGELPGGMHCRPDGGDSGSWVKLGWAYNQKKAPVSFDPEFDDQFPEIVLRGAARLNPALKAYYGRLPRNMAHYGGYYTLTEENWPLIGETKQAGFFVAGALSGFGTMAACASGDLLAKIILGQALPEYAGMLSPQRYSDPLYVEQMQQQKNRGIL